MPRERAFRARGTMLKSRIEAAQLVADEFLPSEKAIDDANAALARLYNTLFEARKASNISLHVGRDAFNHIAQALHHQSQARDHMLAAHPALLAVLHEVLPERMLGDVGCPRGDARSPLALVS
jgi:hypothetical protein